MNWYPAFKGPALNNAKRAITENPIESLATLIGVIIAVLGSLLSGSPGRDGAIGVVLTVLGFGLAAVAQTWIYGRRRSNEDLRGRLNVVATQLATASAHIFNALRDYQHGIDTPDSIAGRVRQATNSITALLQQIEDITGVEISGQAEDILAQRSAMEVFAGGLIGDLAGEVRAEVEASEGEDDAAVDARIEALLDSRLVEFVAALSTGGGQLQTPAEGEDEKESHEVPCPFDGSTVKVEIATKAGSAAHGYCGSCGKSFHVNRTREGIVVRKPGESQQLSQMEVGERIAVLLKQRGVDMLTPQIRLEILEHVLKALKAGEISVMGDIEGIVEDVVEISPTPARIRWPVMKSLSLHGIVPTRRIQGPLSAQPVEATEIEHEVAWLMRAHASWISFALVKLRHDDIPTDQLRDALIGRNPDQSLEEAFTLAEKFLKEFEAEREDEVPVT